MRLLPLAASLLTCAAAVAAPTSFHQSQDPRLAGGLALVADASDHGVAAAQHAAPLHLMTDAAGLVRVEVRCNRWDDGLPARFEALGLEVDSFDERWWFIYGWIAPEDLRGLADQPEIAVVRPYLPPVTFAGAVTGQHDEHMAAATARANFGVTGSGVRVGILSDSIARTAAVGGGIVGNLLNGSNPQASGDLPPNVGVLQEGPASAEVGDEGAAMGEIVYDTAPGCTLAFATGFGGQTAFAANIRGLAYAAGCNVIVDDLLYPEEAMFQDGPVADAVREVAGHGVAYFSSAGNYGTTGVFQPYLDSNPVVNIEDVNPPSGDELHDFTGTGGRFVHIALPSGTRIQIVLQWNEPFFGSLGPGSQTDLDMGLLASPSPLSTILVSSGNDQGRIGMPVGDPIEMIDYTNAGGTTLDTYLAVNHYHGRRDGLVLRLVLSLVSGPPFSVDTAIVNDATIYGHAAVPEASAVAAVDYAEILFAGGVTPPVGRIDSELFSSRGDLLPIYYTPSGAALATPRLTHKPDSCAPDQGNTTFFLPGYDREPDGFPNFPGTSASAPAAAAVAALLIERANDLGGRLTPQAINNILARSAIDMDTPGRDFISGWGRVDANAALGLVVAPASAEVIADAILGLVPPSPPADINYDQVWDATDLVLRVNQ